MIFLSQIRDWIRTFNAAENYYIGKMNNKERSIGVFQLTPRSPTRAIGQPSSYEVRRISLKLHWNNNQNDSERAAYELYRKLEAVRSFNIVGERNNEKIRLLINDNGEGCVLAKDDQINPGGLDKYGRFRVELTETDTDIEPGVYYYSVAAQLTYKGKKSFVEIHPPVPFRIRPMMIKESDMQEVQND